MAKTEITTMTPGRWRVMIDGVEAEKMTSLTLRMEAGKMPSMEIVRHVFGQIGVAIDADVKVKEVGHPPLLVKMEIHARECLETLDEEIAAHGGREGVMPVADVRKMLQAILNGGEG